MLLRDLLVYYYCLSANDVIAIHRHPYWESIGTWRFQSSLKLHTKVQWRWEFTAHGFVGRWFTCWLGYVFIYVFEPASTDEQNTVENKTLSCLKYYFYVVLLAKIHRAFRFHPWKFILLLLIYSHLFLYDFQISFLHTFLLLVEITL